MKTRSGTKRGRAADATHSEKDTTDKSTGSMPLRVDRSSRFSTTLEQTQHEEIVRLRSQIAQLQQGSGNSSSPANSVSISLTTPSLPVEEKSEETSAPEPEWSDPKSESDNEVEHQELGEVLVKELLRELRERFEYMYGFFLAWNRVSNLLLIS